MITASATAPSGPLTTTRSDPTDEVTVARLMAAIAAGDQPSIWALRELADVPVRSRVRGELRRLGVKYDPEDLDGLVVDAVLAIADIAGGWRPGAAPPWTWAHHRVVGVVHRWVGTFADSLDELGAGDPGGVLGWLEAGGTTLAAADSDRVAVRDAADAVVETMTALQQLAADLPNVAVLHAALSTLASPRDGALWLSVLDEREAGNRLPAVTVGARFGMRPEAVRKAVQRVWQRLVDAIADERFAALASLPVLSGRLERHRYDRLCA